MNRNQLQQCRPIHYTLVAAIMLSLCCCVAQADELDTYTGYGSVYVLDNGEIVIHYATSREAESVFAPGTQLTLISDGTTESILFDGEEVPQGTTKATTLDGDGSVTAGQFEGTIVLFQDGDAWELCVFDAESTEVFHSNFYAPTDATSSRSTQPDCQVTCGSSSCSCNLNGSGGVCWCFCGLFGEPHCVKIKLVFAIF